jgi:hypothetical protein
VRRRDLRHQRPDRGALAPDAGYEPQVTGNHAGSKRAEKAAIKKLLNSSRFLLPVHDKPAKVEEGAIVGRLDMQVPGSTVQSMPRREWFAA